MKSMRFRKQITVIILFLILIFTAACTAENGDSDVPPSDTVSSIEETADSASEQIEDSIITGIDDGDED